MEKLFKVLDTDASAYHGGQGQWHTTRKWMPPIEGELVPCMNGYHLCRVRDLIHWLGPSIWEATCRGERVDIENKIVVREARLVRKLETWNEKTARLFACDCAERALERIKTPDPRSVAAIAVSRRFANGTATREELAAAGDAAEAAAGTTFWATADITAWDAARAAAGTVAFDVARAAAWAVSWAATEAAVWDAAGPAARDAEQGWQTERLMEYLYP